MISHCRILRIKPTILQEAPEIKMVLDFLKHLEFLYINFLKSTSSSNFCCFPFFKKAYTKAWKIQFHYYVIFIDAQ